jgi:peptidoglycan/LPS O-acetylase OafA/YrhL
MAPPRGPAALEEERPGEAGAAIEQAGEQRSARIESLRALAALAVLVGHVAAVSYLLVPGVVVGAQLDTFQQLLYGGGFGVFFFFVLTGYLIFWPFAKRDYGDGGRVDLTRYAVNRALRILPLYYFVVVLVLVFQEQPLGVWARFLTLTENFFPHTAAKIVGPAWSLVVELHFYILIPLIAWALAKLASGARSRAAANILGLGIASLAVRYATVYGPEEPDARWRLSLPATFPFFAPGMMLALLRIGWERSVPAWVRGPVASADLWIVAALPFWALGLLGSYDLDFLLCIAAFLMVGACVLPLRAGPLTRALEWRPLAVIGVASYSLYLLHVPGLEVLLDLGIERELAVVAITAIPASILVALLPYRLVEQPFLRLRHQWSRAAAEKPA